MKKLIVIADWGGDSLTCQEVRSAVSGFLKIDDGAVINFVHSTPSTIHTGFLLNQIVETEERLGHPLKTVIFINTDPRVQSDDKLTEAKGAELIIARLKSGLYVLGPNANYSFSLIKPKIDEVFIYKGLDKGSQFRSRDLYARVAAHLMDEMEDELDLEEINTNLVPVLDRHYIGHIDNFGNIKTTIKLSELKVKYKIGDYIEMTVNDTRKKALFTDNLFGGGPGILVIYPGSSGQKDDPFIEVTVWRHFTEKNPTTGLQEFNNPRPGMEINYK